MRRIDKEMVDAIIIVIYAVVLLWTVNHLEKKKQKEQKELALDPESDTIVAVENSR